MLPLTIATVKKLADRLTSNNILNEQIAVLAQSCNVAVPGVASGQVVLSSAPADMCDRDVQLSYPRVCLYSAAVRNTLREKFRSLSGGVAVVAEVWSSGNLVGDADTWIHYYVEAVTNILRQNIGDWGDGVFFSGLYDVQISSPRVGGLGYVTSAKITCNLAVSRN